MLFDVLQVLTVILVAVAMAMALAHALELPGKMRLDKENSVMKHSVATHIIRQRRFERPP